MTTRDPIGAGAEDRALPGRALVLGAASSLLGTGSLLLLVVFLYAGPLRWIELRVGDGVKLAGDALLSLAFFLQHSIMTRRWFRRRLSRLIREELHAAVYSAASGLFLLALLLLWQGTAPAWFEARGPVRWISRGLFLGALLGFAWGSLALGPLDTFGVRGMLRRLRGETPPEAPPFTVRGPYRWVRHPLYFFALVLFWAQPELTADRLLFNGMWTAWVLVGTFLEERDLVVAFGEPYREYQRRVPMLLPYRLPAPARPAPP